MRTLPAILLILALATSPAFAVVHKATGFGVDPPFPLSAQPIRYPGSDVTFGIVNVGKPTPPPGDDYLCLIRFKLPGEVTRSLDQAGINALFASEQYRDLAVANAAQNFQFSRSSTFDERGMTGLEMVGAPAKGRRGAEDVRLFISLFSSPRGSVSLSCATTADQIDSATEVFRALRHTIILPTDPE